MPDNILSVQQILDLVEESNGEFASEVYIPSLNKNIPVRPMTASHLKEIIKTSVSGIFTNNEFNLLMSEVIKDVMDPVDFPQINLYDKTAVIIQLRNLNVRSEIDVKLSFFSKGSEIGETDYRTINLTEVIADFKNKNASFTDEVIKYGTYEIALAYPTIAQEYKFNRHFSTTYYTHLDRDMSKEELKKLFGPLFINEITQYVKFIKIKDNEIDFYQLPAQDSIQVMESFSSGLISHIIDRIDKVFGKQINELLHVETLVGKKLFNGSLTLDPAFFS